ncbi:hypothetical protein [Streptomyces sp. NPDC058572]|uniref:hypothetical protein n=1 Tax=Streptomyces sp. NPDC058572 TaxID=3346546 RepID=UPI00364AFD8F
MDGLSDGTELPVLDWHHGGTDPDDLEAEQAAIDLALARGATAAVVSLPAVEVAELHAAVMAVVVTTSPEFVTPIRLLQHRLGAARAMVRLPSSDYKWGLSVLRRALVKQQGVHDDTTVERILRVIRYAGEGWLTAGPWPVLRDALEDALRQALAHPGAEGLAARDELFAVISRFMDAHRHATRADDPEQQMLQAQPQDN